MSLQDRIINQFSDSLQTQQDAMTYLTDLIAYASERMVAALLNDKKIIACGNGPAANSALLLSSSLLNRFDRVRPSLPAIALNADVATITAIANDTHFDDIFAKQLRALGQNGDILVAYSDCGYSANIVKAVNCAHDKDIAVIALTGKDGGAISPQLNEKDLELRVPSNVSARIHETHGLISHCLCDLIDHQLFGG
ncbi:MAG: SIS domain-containing protein [Gammaproteobacteria bacterium]